MTEPPPPARRGRFAVGLAAVGILLMVGAIAWQIRESGHQVGTFDNQAALRALIGRLLRVGSALCMIASTFIASSVYARAKLPALMALLLSTGWLGWMLWLWLS